MDNIMNEVDTMNAAQLVGTLQQTFNCDLDVTELQNKIVLRLRNEFPSIAQSKTNMHLDMKVLNKLRGE